MLFRQISDPALAQYSYLLGCQRTREAIVVDPQRDIERYVALARREGLRIAAVTETHIHADFLSGARDLAEETGARLYLSDEGGPDWRYGWCGDTTAEVVRLRDGDAFSVGGVELQVLHTPGHTPEHLSFLVTDRGSGAEEPLGLLSGDFLFVGDLGRPDLLESAAGQAGAREPAARQLFESTRRLRDLEGYLQVWPAHGAGSSCGKALGAVPMSTLGYEKRHNSALLDAEVSESVFVEGILEGQPEPPIYFGRMKRLNRDGVPRSKGRPSPPRVGVESLGAFLERPNLVVLDTRRNHLDFVKQRLPRSVWSTSGLRIGDFAGSLIDGEIEDILLVASERELETLIQQLTRIGLDRIVGWLALEDLALALERFAAAPLLSVDWSGADRLRSEGARVLDVRKASESVRGHLPSAVNVAHTRLRDRAEELSREGRWVVYCARGVRAAAASAFLADRGFDVVHVDGAFSEYPHPIRD